MALKTTQHEELPGLNLTSMIDVVFLLLIFFMVATNFSQSSQQVAVKLSNNANVPSMLPAPDKLEVTVKGDGGLLVDNQPVAINDLVHVIRSKKAQFPALVVGINMSRDARGEAIQTALATVRMAAPGAEVRMGLVR